MYFSFDKNAQFYSAKLTSFNFNFLSLLKFAMIINNYFRYNTPVMITDQSIRSNYSREGWADHAVFVQHCVCSDHHTIERKSETHINSF